MRATLEKLKQIPAPILWSILASVAINLIVLILFFADHDPQVLIWGDAIGYQELAINLVNNDGFGIFSGGDFVPETFRTPGLPFLFATFLFFGLGLKTYIFTLSIFSAIFLPILGWYIGKHFFDPQVGIITGILLALEPLIFTHNWTLLTEIPFLLTLLSGIALLIYTRNEGISMFSFTAGLLFAFAAYIRPAVVPVLIISVLTVIGYYFLMHKRFAYGCILSLVVMLLCLSPYIIRMERTTGEYSLSGTGWRNVYTDYLASIRALNNGTQFIDEKNALKEYAMETLNQRRLELNSPRNSDFFRSYAVPEILGNWKTVAKLQTMLFVTYFTHTDYLGRLQKIDILPTNSVGKVRQSSSRLLLDEGISAFPKIYKEMQNRYFMPLLERVYAGLVFVCAAIGFLVSRSPYRYLVALLLALGYVTSSAIGLGLEGRLRIPVLPFYFMLTACGVLFVSKFLKNLMVSWKK